MLSFFIRSLLLSSSILSTLATPSPFPYYLPKFKRTCDSPQPTEDLLAEHSYLQTNEPLDNTLYNSSLIHDRLATHNSNISIRSLDLTLDIKTHPHPYALKRQTQPTPLFTIDTYFHIVADAANDIPTSVAYVTDKMIADQFAYMSNAYAPFGIAFALLDVTRTVNDTWARNADDLAMKTALRRGSYSALNVYFQTLLSTTDGSGSLMIGKCSLPTTGITPQTPTSAYVLDGCNILSGTLPGSWTRDFNLGGTTVHEVGHWNGLLHPFQGLTCDPADFGDYVADTPQESVETSACPVGKDSCPDSGVSEDVYVGQPDTPNPYGPSGYSGPDPIHNFMDYSQDSCYTGFTAGQGARMVNLWVLLRMGL